jgi:hypothetical protein
MWLEECLDCRLDILRQVRPEVDKLSQFGIIAQDFVQAGGQDRICLFRKRFIYNDLRIPAKGFDSPWGYFIFNEDCGFKRVTPVFVSISIYIESVVLCRQWQQKGYEI